MIINLQTGKSSPSKRVEYLIHGADGERNPDAVHILDGDPELFEEIAKHNPYKTKTYNYLISFAESKEELERKLAQQGKTIEDLYQEVFSFLLPVEYYPRESLNVLAIAHSDTDNFHIHLTIENYDHLNKKSLYIPKTKTETEFYRALERYIKAKYNLSFGKLRTQNKGKAGTEKIKQILERRGEYREKTRDEIKEELTNFFIELIRSGEIESREDLIAYLLSIDGVELHRIGKNYISIRLEGQKKSIRLKGGIYDESKFNELKEYIRTNRRKNTTLEEERRILEEVRRKRESYIAQRRQKHDLERLESVNQERSWSKNREFRKEPEQSTKNPVDRIFPFDWTSVIHSAISPPFQDFSFSLPVESDERTGSKGMHSSTRDSMSIWQQRLDRVSSYSYPAVKLKEMVAMRKKVYEIRKLELEYLKNLDPEVVLNALGITDWQEKNGYLLTQSPLREDNNPSFEVFYGTERNCWIYMDFGTGWRGTSIDLWQAVRGVDYVAAVQEMRKTFGINLLEDGKLEDIKERIKEKIQSEQEKQAEKRKRFAKQEKDEVKKATHRILKIKEPEHPALLKYLEKRGIKEIPDWLKEVQYLYLPKKKYYFALAVQDRNGVWHARNPYGKTNILTSPEQKPTYSLIKRGTKNKTVVIVEGLFDALTLNQELKKPYDIVILNSTTNTERLIKSGILQQYKQVIMAFDNDEAGQKAEKELYEYLKQLDDVKIGKLTYSAGKDINECYLQGNFEIKNVTPKRYWIGKNSQGIVITDRKEVLRKLGIEESRIKRVNSAEDIAQYWKKHRCRGYVELYLSDGTPEEWILKGLEKAVWTKIDRPAWSTIERTKEHRPTKVYKGKYWELDGDIVLDEDVLERPEMYLRADNQEIREVAREAIKRKREIRRIEEEIERERERDDDFGMEL